MALALLRGPLADVPQAEKSLVQDEIAHIKVTSKVDEDRLNLNETALVHSLVAQYLSHEGHVDTGMCFSEEVLGEIKSLVSSDEADLSFINTAEDLDAINRQSESDPLVRGRL